MAAIGELHQIQGEFEWGIEHALSHLNKKNFECCSVPFYFADATWKIRMYCCTEVDNISFELKRTSFGLPVKLKYFVSIKSSDGVERYLSQYNCSLEENSSHIWKEPSRKCMMDHKSLYFPSDTLTLVYKLKSTEKYNTTSCLLANLLDLADSFKQLYAEKRGADLNLNLKGQTFPVHRMMLEARSTISDKKLSEKKKEEMNIGDIDPSSIRAILEYVYTGGTDQLTKENVFFAYTAADKYGMGQLKNICTSYIKRNLTIEWICQVMKFAVEQHADDIDQYTTGYFIENSAKIIKTDQWNTFRKDNHDKAFELLLAKAARTG